MADLTLIAAGHTFPALADQMGDFSDWFLDGLALPEGKTAQVIDPKTEALPDALPDIPGAVVVTGSHAMVSDREDWSEALAAWLAEHVRAGTPVLGVCYGHQLLAHALGGEAGYHAKGIEIGSALVEKTPEAVDDPLLSHLPESFPAQTVHRQTVLRLPEGATVLAKNAHEPHHAVRFAPKAWGVQFHPEFSARAMTAYLDFLAEALEKDGLDRQSLHKAVEPTPDAAQVLRRFTELALGEPS